MGWRLKTAEKELVASFESFILEHGQLLATRKLFIWGASVRGTLFGILLEKSGRNQFAYIDNDPRKWGVQINGHLIVSPKQAQVEETGIFVVVPIEYGAEIRDQLQGWGLEEGGDFSILQPGINEKFVAEFFRKYKNKRLILGETFLNETVIEDKEPQSFKEVLWQTFGREQTKILSLNCLGMEGFYHILRLQSELGQLPEEVWLFLNFETFTEHHHLLSRTQHADVWKMIQRQGNIVSPHFTSYIQQAVQRAQNYQIELAYSPQRTSVDSEEERIYDQKLYLKQEMMYQWDPDWEEGRFLQKLLEFALEHRILVKAILAPVNVPLAKQYYGDLFEQIFSSNCQKLRQLFLNYKADFYDLGRLLASEYFCSEVTINDAVYGAGMKIIIQELLEQMGMGERNS